MTIIMRRPPGWRGRVWAFKLCHGRMLRRLHLIKPPPRTGLLWIPDEISFPGEPNQLDEFEAELMEYLSRPVERRS